MKKIIIFLSLFFIGLNVYAIDIPACTDSEMARLKELANNVEFKKNYKLHVDEEFREVDIDYDIDIVNYDSNLKISYKTVYDSEVSEINPNETTIGSFEATNNVIFYIRAYTPNMCTNKLLKTITVKLPVYNEYYYFHKDECMNNPKFKYCQEFMDVDKSEEEIDKLFKEYLNKDNVTNNNNNSNNMFFIFGGIGIVLVIGVGIVLVILNKKKKNDDL